MLSFSSVAEAYRPDPPSPAGVNFFLTLLRRLAEPEEFQIGQVKIDDERVLYELLMSSDL